MQFRTLRKQVEDAIDEATQQLEETAQQLANAQKQVENLIDEARGAWEEMVNSIAQGNVDGAMGNLTGLQDILSRLAEALQQVGEEQKDLTGGGALGKGDTEGVKLESLIREIRKMTKATYTKNKIIRLPLRKAEDETADEEDENVIYLDPEGKITLPATVLGPVEDARFDLDNSLADLNKVLKEFDHAWETWCDTVGEFGYAVQGDEEVGRKGSALVDLATRIDTATFFLREHGESLANALKELDKQIKKALGIKETEEPQQ